MRLDIHYLWSSKHARWIVIGLLCFFTVLILAQWVFLFSSSGPSIEPIGIKTTEKNKIKQDSLKILLTSTMFGEYVPSNLNEPYVKKSMLDVSVSGVMFSDKPGESQVIIRSSNGQEKTYKVGDSLPGGVVIKRITADGVLVEHGGVLESLSLPKNDLIFEPPLKPLKEE